MAYLYNNNLSDHFNRQNKILVKPSEHSLAVKTGRWSQNQKPKSPREKETVNVLTAVLQYLNITFWLKNIHLPLLHCTLLYIVFANVHKVSLQNCAIYYGYNN